MTLEELSAYIASHNRERIIFDKQTPLETSTHLIEEARELQASLIEAEIGGSATSVANEIADCLILLITIADKCGIDLTQALAMKAVRNEFKGSKFILNNGYDDPYKVSKEVYEMMGGDEIFYQAYLLLIADE